MDESSKPLRPPRYPWIGKRPFYGWVIVAVGAVTQFFQGVASQGFTTYMGPLETQFGWDKATLAGPRSVTQVAGSVLGPVEGWMVDRFGPRRVVAAGIFVMGLGFILFGMTDSLWMFYLSSFVIVLGTGLQGLLVMSVTVNNWFRRKRTIAQSVMGLGYSLTGVIGVPVIVLIQKYMGWEASAYITGLVIWVMGFPFALMLRTGPETVGEVPDGRADITVTDNKAPDDEYSFTLKESMKTRTFWLLAIGWSVSNLGIIGIQIHLFPHLDTIGLSRETASLVWGVAGFISIPARLVGGFLGDRLPKNIILGVSMISMAVAVYLLAIADSAGMAFAYAVLFGIGWGMRTPIINAVQGEYFGRTSQGVIRGWLQSLGLPILIITPVLVGHMYDIQGTYEPTFIVIALVKLAGAVLLFMATRPKTPQGYIRNA